MAKEICISSTPHETRLAILEDDQLAEIYYERENEYTLAGSIYNGRVTRVLPGMQSAFVDVGLERDAFLYVTDFMELEDPEETDEVEKAATTGNQAPREVRRTAPQESNAVRTGQKPVQKIEPKPEQKQEPRQDRAAQDRPAKERRLLVESAPDASDAPVQQSTYVSEQSENAQDDSNEPGTKRWRGRRRRRGGRGGSVSQEAQPETHEASNTFVEEVTEDEPEVAPEIQASAGISSDKSSATEWSAPAPRAERPSTPAPFVLPGESLKKYGGTASSDAPEAAVPAAPVRPASSFKPATMIESPLAWDGSGLLPGESLSKHRSREAEPSTEVNPEPHGVFSDAPLGQAPDAIEEQELVEETESLEPHIAPDASFETTEEVLVPELAEDHLVDEVTTEAITETAPVAAVTPAPTEAPCEPLAHATEPIEIAVPEPDASASHNVDPLPPTGFRLFGLGGKKKKEEEVETKSTAVATVSTYAPGSGLIEEEMIEEEEFDAPRPHHHGKADDHDLEDFEEETLPKQMRTGDLGELLQEAHLDHRIQRNFDSTGEEALDDEEPFVEGQPVIADAQRRDRGGKGRRGRAGQGTPTAPTARRGGPTRRSSQMSDLPIISDLLKPGQEILVQIAKEPIAQKGARITSHIALPGRFLVFMPTVTHVGVSRKIESDAERQRLKRILTHERGEAAGGFIVRTAAEGASEEELRADLRFLIHLWNDIKQRSDSSKSPALIYHDLSLIERILRDQVSSNFTNIWVDSEVNYERIVKFLNHFSPTLVRRVKLYTKETPLFEHFGIQDEISKALRSKVWLKSGGSIVINQTEALVAIDINTGKYVGKSARLEDTIVKTNLDAVPEIVRQIRLRDLGGIIVIDFIDMDDRKNRYKVMAALEEALKSDRAPTKVLQFNDFGLVAITRKRVKQSLERTLSVPCPTCQATGMVKSPATVCNEIYTELRKMKKHFEGADVLLRVNPETVKVLKANNASWITEFEELVSKNILIKSDAALHPEQFDIQG
jgi:ribonuclease G